MSRLPRGCALIAAILLLPAVGWAQVGQRPGKTSLRAASNAFQAPDTDVRRAAGPDPAARMAAGREALRGRGRPNDGQGNAPRDSVGNGIAIGALTGALGGAALTGVMYAQCNGTCDAPAVPAVLFPTMGLFAGVGALVGFLIDRAR